MEKVKVGIIGCGNISDVYLKNCCEVFDILEVVACSDIIYERAVEKARKFNVSKACTVEELLEDKSIELIINLTVPKSHAGINIKALESGKNVYCEKPFSISNADGIAVLAMSKEKGLLVGCAPDTFLGGGLQTCRKLIDDGWIGKPVAASCFMMCHGPEGWHPNPEFFYKEGGGPLLDMGPYYLTALVSLLGPVSRLSGSARATFDERMITHAERYGQKIKVETPTHITGILEFTSGGIATITTSFDVWKSQNNLIEIYGSEGTMIVPDPNTFGGPVYLNRYDHREWMEIPLSYGFYDNSRGLGVADMAYSLRSGRINRANGELAYHVLEIMNGIIESSKTGKHYTLASTCERPAPVPRALPKNAYGL